MAHAIEVVVERESANDADGTVVEIYLQPGSPVKKGERIFDIETSKAVQEIYAPADGFLMHSLTLGDNIDLGGAIARIVADLASAAAAVATPAAPQAGTAAPRTGLPRLSRDATALATQYGLGPADFDRDLVTATDVRRRLNLEPPAPKAVQAVPTMQAPPVAARAPVSANVKPVAAHKRDEIEFLSRGAGASMLSVLGAVVGYGDLIRDGEGFFERKIVDIVAFEASRLMRAHPKMNAAWRDGGVELHRSVHAGVAFDNDGRLLVYGIEDADGLELEDLQDEIMEGFKKYARNKLSLKELTRATFTITDLSATGVDYVLPLLPNGQSCIIGIVNGGRDGFALYLGFDHRVTEGLAASRFLAALRAKVQSAIAMLYIQTEVCAFCDGAHPVGKGLLRIAGSGGMDVLCCQTCWVEG